LAIREGVAEGEEEEVKVVTLRPNTRSNIKVANI